MGSGLRGGRRAAAAVLAVLLVVTIAVLLLVVSTDSIVPRTGRGNVGAPCGQVSGGGCTTAWGQHVDCPPPPGCGNANCTTQACELRSASAGTFYGAAALVVLESSAWVALVMPSLRGRTSES